MESELLHWQAPFGCGCGCVYVCVNYEIKHIIYVQFLPFQSIFGLIPSIFLHTKNMQTASIFPLPMYVCVNNKLKDITYVQFVPFQIILGLLPKRCGI